MIQIRNHQPTNQFSTKKKFSPKLVSLIINKFISRVPTITLYFHIPPTVKRNTKDPLLLARHS